MYTPDLHLPVRRLQLDAEIGALVPAPKKAPFLRGPIPLEWLAIAAKLPGKTLNVAVAVRWHQGMAKGKPFKLSRTALLAMNVGRDAAADGLTRLENAGLIKVERSPGQRPTILVLD